MKYRFEGYVKTERGDAWGECVVEADSANDAIALSKLPNFWSGTLFVITELCADSLTEIHGISGPYEVV